MINGFLAALMAFMWSGLLPVLAQSADDEEGAIRFIQQVSRSLEAIEDGEREAPRDRWDPQYVVDTVGIEPAHLYAWVRDEVVWMPYPGALRGPTGVLMDRIGNSLDQALLLAELLRRAGHEVRLARAKLPPETARTLWQRMLAERNRATASVDQAIAPQGGASALDSGLGTAGLQPVAAGEPSSEGAEAVEELGEDVFEVDVPTDPMEAAELYELDAEAVSGELSNAAARAERISVGMDTRVLDQALRLLRLVALPETDPAEVAEATAAALADYWWVQLNEGGGWIDLDPIGAAEMGSALIPAAETFNPDALPQEMEYAVTLRVATEQWRDGATQEHVIVEQTFRPRDMMGRTITIGHMPMLWTADWPELGDETLQIKLRSAVYAQREWLPFISIGDEQLALSSVRDTGELNEFPAPPNPFAAVGVPAAGIFSKAGDLLSSDDQGAQPDTSSVAPRPEGELVAEWLDFVVTGPDGTRTSRREIFDLIGPAARASGDIGTLTLSDEKKLARAMAMLAETHVVLFSARLAPEFIVHVAAEHALAGRSFFEEVGRDPFSKAPANAGEIFAKLPPLAAAAIAVAATRLDANPLANSVYLDRPNIIAEHATLTRGKGGDFFVRHAIDIVENGVGIDPAEETATSLRMIQGIADTNAEALVLGNGAENSGTADAFAATPIDDSWTLLRPGDSSALAGLDLPPDVAARIAADLEAGKLAIVPTRQRTADGQIAGWWRIDPVTGETLGMGPNGWGAAMVEYALVLIAQTVIAMLECQIAKSVTAGLKAGSTSAALQRQAVLTKSEAILCGVNGVLSGLRGMLVGAVQTKIYEKYKAPASSPGSGTPSASTGGTGTGAANASRPGSGTAPQGGAGTGAAPAPGGSGAGSGNQPSSPAGQASSGSNSPAGSAASSNPGAAPPAAPAAQSQAAGPASKSQPAAAPPSNPGAAPSKDQAYRNAVDAARKEGEAVRTFEAAKAKADQPGATPADKAAADQARQQALGAEASANAARQEAIAHGVDPAQWQGAYQQGLQGSGTGSGTGAASNSGWSGWSGGQGPVAPPSAVAGSPAPAGSGTLPGLGGPAPASAAPASTTIRDMQSPVATTMTGLAGLGGAGSNLGL
ncbi:hypothetical protein [Devosia sp. CN2-171]|uniref:hypothetical protein n=1 Tax=Devosia sp. CN2-171 TaxID=3400909 RepID=UPI003BF77909